MLAMADSAQLTRAGVGRHLAEGDLAGAIAAIRPIVQELEDPDDRMLLGRLAFLACDFSEATAQLERAYNDFQQRGLHRQAAIAAADVGRVYFDGLENLPAGQGWLNRATRLLEREEPCVEQGYAALALVGCSVASADELDVSARRALDLAHRFNDPALECKALGEWGLALVSMGHVRDGMARLDEAFTMILGGDCREPMVTSHVKCCMLSACERAGDASRAEAWLRLIEETSSHADLKPAVHTLAHCWSAFGTVLCHVGRWAEGETALRLGLAKGDSSFLHTKVSTRSALADLWIRQGRLPEAAALIEEHVDRVEVMGPRARLHMARGEFEYAAAVARQALRQLSGDRLRSASLLMLLVDAALGLGHLGEAEDAVRGLEQLAQGTDAALLAAQAGLAHGKVAAARGNVDAAAAQFDHGLAALRESEWPLLRAALHLELARVYRESNVAQASVEAQAALSIYRRIGAPEADVAIELLNDFGVAVEAPPLPPGPLDQLSNREREVLGLVARGLSNPDIARTLFITPKTAEHHVSNILGKLGLKNRAEAAAFAASFRISRA